MIDTGVPRLEEVERVIIEFAMDLHGDYRGKAAEELGMGVRTLHNKLKNYTRSEVQPGASELNSHREFSKDPAGRVL